jgi:hypothetical protein
VSRTGGIPLIAMASLASLALVATYLALGGAGYEPTPVADPCDPRPWRAPEGIEESAEQFSLSALDGAACELGVSRETLAVALATEESRDEFAAEYGIEEARLEAAVRAGLVRAIDDAEAADALNPFVATGLRAAASRVPLDEGIALIEDARAVFEDAQGLLQRGEDLLDEILP